jgi:hypothetical protein
MQEVQGNIWNSGCTYTAVTTNGIIKSNGNLVMGKGIALQASQRYPSLPRILAQHVRAKGNVPCLVPECKILSFPTKHNWHDPSDPVLIVKSARLAMDLLPRDCTCAMSRPGCGNGNLRWEQVKPLIDDILDDRFFVYSL